MKYFLFFSILTFSLTSNAIQKGSNGFVENKGQVTDENRKACPSVKFIYADQGFKIILKENSFSYEVYSIEEGPANFSEAGPLNTFPNIPPKVSIHSHRIDISFLNSNLYPEIIKENVLPGYINFLNVDDHVKHVQVYGKVIYKDLYPKIDLVFYFQNQKPKYDFILNPGASVQDIKMVYEGGDKFNLSEAGEVRIKTSLGEIIETIPASYQKEDSKNVKVEYQIKKSIISFKVKAYDKKKTLVIDPIPVLVWEKKIGGYGDVSTGTTIDSKDNIIITGYTGGGINITTGGAYQTTIGGKNDAFIAKYNSSGTVEWATYFGGPDMDYGEDITIDSHDNILIAGFTLSQTNIATPGTQQVAFSGEEDLFIAKFDSSGSLTWATYYGGTDYEEVGGICVDKSDNIIISGSTGSQNNIVSPGCYQSSMDTYSYEAFIAKFNPAGIREWGTYYGHGGTNGGGIDTDSYDNIIITGRAVGNDNLIASAGSHQTTYGGGLIDAFVAKFNPAGYRIWGTYYGGSGDENNGDIGKCVVVDSQDNILIAGYTVSPNNIATSGAFKSILTGIDGYLAKFSANGNLLWGTYYGGSEIDRFSKIAIDHFNNIIVTGVTTSSDNIATSCAYQTVYGGIYPNGTGFIVKFSSGGSRIWGTYYTPSVTSSNGRGIAINSINNIIGSGFYNNSAYIAVFKEITPSIPAITANGPITFCPGDSVTLFVSSGVKYLWTNSDTAQSISAKSEGSYYATVTDTNGCALKSSSIDVTFIRPSVSVSGPIKFCSGDNVTLTSSKGNSYQWSTGDNGQAIFVTDGGSYTVTTEDTNGCVSTSKPLIVTEVFPPSIWLGNDTTLCVDKEKNISFHIPDATYLWSNGSTKSNFTINSPGIYKVEVTVAPCPAVKDSISIKYISEIDYTVPNLITPNEDDKNDYFKIGNILPNTTVSIYNSWGALVYKSDNYQNDWGAFEVNGGIYYYHTSNPNTCVKEYSGWLQVIK